MAIFPMMWGNMQQGGGQPGVPGQPSPYMRRIPFGSLQELLGQGMFGAGGQRPMPMGPMMGRGIMPRQAGAGGFAGGQQPQVTAPGYATAPPTQGGQLQAVPGPYNMMATNRGFGGGY